MQVVKDANQAKNGSWGPSLSKPLRRHLPLVPDFTMFLGSPIGLFLTLRGAHAVFDDMRDMTMMMTTAAAAAAISAPAAATAIAIAIATTRQIKP